MWVSLSKPSIGVDSYITLENIKIKFSQNTAATNISQILHYPPGIYAFDSSRVRIKDVEITQAWDGAVLLGNCGGWTVDGLWVSAFHRHFDVYVSLDSMHFNDVRFWPFDIVGTASQVVWTANAVGWYIGEMDDAAVTNSMCYGLEQGCFVTNTGAPSYSFINISNFDFDGSYGIIHNRGIITCSGCTFSSGHTPLISVNNASLTVNGGWFNGPFDTAPVAVSVTATFGNISRLSLSKILWNGLAGTSLAVAGIKTIAPAGGLINLDIDGINFYQNSGVVYTAPLIWLNGVTMGRIAGVNFSSMVGGSGVGIQLDDDWEVYARGNVYNGWTVTRPPTATNGSWADNAYDYPHLRAFANLGTPAYQGAMSYCLDCKVASGSDNTCATGGTGALAVYVNLVWRCFNAQN